MTKSSRSSIVGFDGIHRSGKGTQINQLELALQSQGLRVLTVRGDGRREGRGESPGDPYDIAWQQTSRHLVSSSATIDDWHASAYRIVHEMHDHANSGQYDIVIADRTLVSRAALLITGGIVPRGGDRFLLDELYPVREHVPIERRVLTEEVVPDIIFNLDISTQAAALARLEQDDPKYAFRFQNITETFDSYKVAVERLPIDIANVTHNLEADRPVSDLHNEVVRVLGASALI